jgi:RNA 3'-terminal phosphate cyclase-like protein
MCNNLLKCISECEVNLIRLLDKLTNGSRIVVTETGTSLYFQPGILAGGQVDHECCTQRGIAYYLELLIAVGPFCKKPLNCTLKGVTNNKVCVLCELISYLLLPIMIIGISYQPKFYTIILCDLLSSKLLLI